MSLCIGYFNLLKPTGYVMHQQVLRLKPIGLLYDGMEDKNAPKLQVWNERHIEVEGGLFENLLHEEVSVK